MGVPKGRCVRAILAQSGCVTSGGAGNCRVFGIAESEVFRAATEASSEGAKAPPNLQKPGGAGRKGDIFEREACFVLRKATPDSQNEAAFDRKKPCASRKSAPDSGEAAGSFAGVT